MDLWVHNVLSVMGSTIVNKWCFASIIVFLASCVYVFVHYLLVLLHSDKFWGHNLFLALVPTPLTVGVMYVVIVLLGRFLPCRWGRYLVQCFYTAIQVIMTVIIRAGVVWERAFAVCTMGAILLSKGICEVQPLYDSFIEFITFSCLASFITELISMLLKKSTMDVPTLVIWALSFLLGVTVITITILKQTKQQPQNQPSSLNLSDQTLPAAPTDIEAAYHTPSETETEYHTPSAIEEQLPQNQPSSLNFRDQTLPPAPTDIEAASGTETPYYTASDRESDKESDRETTYHD